MFLVILVGLIFPFPLAIHCLVLTMLNRRSHPVMIAGAWDFAEVLFAVSGFLFFGGPCILAGFNQRYREFLLYGGLRSMPSVTGAVSSLWLAVWIGYFVIVLGIAAYLLWRRRQATAVYNIEPDAFQDCLAVVLDRLKLDWVRNGDRVYIDGRPAPARSEGSEGLREAPSGSSRRKVVLALDVFPTMRHVSIHWPDDAGPLRREVEDRLALAFADIRTHDNPVGGWLLTVAGCLFSVMLFTMTAVAFAIYAATKS